MKPDLNTLYEGDCREVMAGWPDAFIDTTITDVPYGLSKEPDIAEVLSVWLAGEDYRGSGGGFMGKEWDSFVPGPDVWREVYRVMKPGGALLAFGHTRTVDLLSIAIRLAGFRKFDEISYHHGGLPPRIDWVYGTGYPGSYNIAKGIEGKLTTGSANWNEWRNLEGQDKPGGLGYAKLQAEQGYRPEDYTGNGRNFDLDPTTPEAQAWDGWGTSLKPAHEIILCFYKPTEGGYAENALEWGVSGLWIEGGMVGDTANGRKGGEAQHARRTGRWPANIIHDGSPEIVGQFPETSSWETPPVKKASAAGYQPRAYGKESRPEGSVGIVYGDSGSAARFFYCAKPSPAEKDRGLENRALVTKVYNGQAGESSADMKPLEARFTTERRNFHPTVKPLELMKYLCRLTRTPTGGIVFDPFAGSCTTPIAAIATQREWLAIEKEYAALGRERIKGFTPQLSLFD